MRNGRRYGKRRKTVIKKPKAEEKWFDVII
jgi:hypothetical protein